MSERTMLRVGWVAVAIAAAAILLWPLVAEIRIANDDIKFVRLPERELPLSEALATAWATAPSFRPLEILMAHASDPVSLACPAVVPVQGVGLLALLAATLALAQQALPGVRATWPVVLMLVLLSPATTASVWQMDSCSQTWSAALGAWSVWLAWRWVDGSARGRSSWWALAALFVAVPLGLTIKENFYGWALGLALASILAAFAISRRSTAAALRSLIVLVPVLVVPAAHLACRLRWSALPGLLGTSGGESRYQAEFGGNLLINAVASIAGAVGFGPFHLVLNPDAPAILRSIPVIAIATMFGVIVIGGGLAVSEPRAFRGVRWTASLFASLACLISLAATLPMRSVSELYGLGANVGCALIAVSCGVALWNAGTSQHRGIRIALSLVAAAVAGAGTYGLASRAVHFGIVWSTVRTLNDAIVRFQPTLPALHPGDQGPAGVVHVPTACLVGATHSQYVMPPLQAIDLNLTQDWLDRRDSTRTVRFSIGTSPQHPGSRDLVLDCSFALQHGHW